MGNVRHAAAEDFPRLIDMAREMHAESPVLRVFEFDAGKVEQTLTGCLKSGVVLVHVGDDGEINGTFVGLVGEWWFSRRRMFADLGFYVTPAARSTLAAFRLIGEVKSWCEGIGLEPQDVQVGVSTGLHSEDIGRLYERMGFERFGGLYRLKGF